jgi:hypothetical protein
VSIRLEIKKPLTTTAVKKQLGMLADLGEQKAIEAMNASIRNGWQGLFPDKAAITKNGNGSQQPPPKQRCRALTPAEIAEINAQGRKS